VFFRKERGRERDMLDENDSVTAILKDPEEQDALRLITRIAIREVALAA
jgi:hypothetical protein